MEYSKANHKIVFERKVIGLVKTFDTKMEYCKANDKKMFAECS